MANRFLEKLCPPPYKYAVPDNLKQWIYNIPWQRIFPEQTAAKYQAVNFRFMWPCIINVGEERTNRWHMYTCLFTISLISTCFGHHYVHRQENRLYKTAYGVSLDMLAAVVCSRARAERTVWMLVFDSNHSHSAFSLCPGSTQPQPTQPG